MKLKRRIVLVRAAVRSPLKEEQISFIQSTTYNNLGEVYKLASNSFTLSFGARKTRESDIERSLLVCLAIRDHIDGIKFGVSYSLASITEKKTGSLKIEGAITKKVDHLLKIATWDNISTDESISKIYSRVFDIRPLKVKGKDVLNVFGFKEIPSRIRGLREAYGKLVGRDKEFDELKKLIYQIAADQGQIVGVSGEAGIGKTRFTHELKTILKLRGINFYEGMFPYFGGSSYKGYKDIISEIANIKPDDSAQSLDKKLLRIGKKYSLEITDVNFLTNLYSLIPVSDTLKHLTEEQIKLGTFVAVKKLLFAIAQDPLVIILEDMQNADALSVELSNFLCEGLPEKKLLFFMNYRPEFSSEFEKKIYFNPIKLKRFDEAQAREFLGSLLSTSFIPKNLLLMILKKSAGNPLYIEELIRSLLDRGKIRVVANKLELTKDIETGDIQPTVHGVISYRMEKLDPETRKVLKWASVGGDAIDIKMLKTIVGRDISKDIETLEIRDFIVEKSIYPEEIYRFRHDLIREVAYESISTSTKKSIHLKIGNYLEKKFKKEIEENVEEIANHFVESSDARKGFDYALRAANKLKANYSNEGAIRFYKVAFKLTDKLPANKTRDIKKSIIEELQDIFITTAKFKDAEWYLEKYKKLGTKNLKEKANFEFLKGSLEFRKGHLESGQKHLEKALDLSSKSEKFITIRIKSLALLARLCSFRDDNKKGKMYAHRVLEEAPKNFSNEIGLAYERLGFISNRESSYNDAIYYYKKAIHLYKINNNLTALSGVYGNLAAVYHMLGKGNEVIKHENRSLAIAKDIGNVSSQGVTHMNLGVFHIRNGKIKNGIAEYQKALDILTQNNQISFLVMVYSNFASIHEFIGDYGSALGYLEQSNKLTKVSPLKFWIGANLLMEGKIHLQKEDLKNAEYIFNESRKIFDEIKDYKKLADLEAEIIKFYILKNNPEQINETIKRMRLFPSSISALAKQQVYIAKLKAQLFLRDSHIFDPSELSNYEEFNWERKFDLYSNLARYFKYIQSDKNHFSIYCEKAVSYLTDLFGQLSERQRNCLKSKPDYRNFFLEFKDNRLEDIFKLKTE